jgi:5'/3'-nucleotidase SurE
MTSRRGWGHYDHTDPSAGDQRRRSHLVEQRCLDGLEGVPTYGVQAVPAFIALIAARGAFGPPPDLVLSGINRGINTGHAILHSGTVGATFTGSTHGCRGMAVSIEVGTEIEWDTAAQAVAEALPWVIDADEAVVLNVNVPNVPPHAVKGVRRAGLARQRWLHLGHAAAASVRGGRRRATGAARLSGSSTWTLSLD